MKKHPWKLAEITVRTKIRFSHTVKVSRNELKKNPALQNRTELERHARNLVKAELPLGSVIDNQIIFIYCPELMTQEIEEYYLDFKKRKTAAAQEDAKDIKKVLDLAKSGKWERAVKAAWALDTFIREGLPEELFSGMFS